MTHANTQPRPAVECRVVHPALVVRDIKAAVDFYTAKLGFRFDFEWGEPPTFAGVTLDRVQVLVLVTVIVAMTALGLFIARTTTGKAMRAVAADNEIASLMGIHVDRVIVTTFAIGGLLAGVAAVLYSLTFESVSYFMGFRPGIAAFTAAVLGGIGSIYGAALGGVMLGLLQSLGPALILTGYGVPSPFQLKDAFTFLVLVLVLIFRPGGLLGSGDAEKV